ncbi:MAG: HNH endonuclease [Acidimicrobiales bacterium]
MIERDGPTCQTCGVAVHPKCNPRFCAECLHVGHIIALADGGPDTLGNLHVQCAGCNTRGPMRRTPLIRMPEW